MVTKVSSVSSTVSGRSTGWAHRKRKPTTNISRSFPDSAARGFEPRDSSAPSRPKATHRRLTAETRKVAPSTPRAQSAPTPPAMSPAAAGPHRVPTAKVPISRPLAAVRSSPRTRFGTAVTYATSNSVFRAVTSAVTTYSTQIRGPASQMSGTAPSSSARTRSQVIIRRRRSVRSTTCPANIPVAMPVTPVTTVIRPIWTTSPVASRTSRGSASSEIDPPRTDSA